MDIEVSVAQLKARLSEYLRLVERGSAVTVMRHDQRVALLTPLRSEDDDLVIRPACGGPDEWGTIEVPPFKLDRDIVDYLLEDRRERDLPGRPVASGR